MGVLCFLLLVFSYGIGWNRSLCAKHGCNSELCFLRLFVCLFVCLFYSAVVQRMYSKPVLTISHITYSGSLLMLLLACKSYLLNCMPYTSLWKWHSFSDCHILSDLIVPSQYLHSPTPSLGLSQVTLCLYLAHILKPAPLYFLWYCIPASVLD